MDIGVDWEARVDWDGLRAARIARTTAAMARMGIDALLVQRFENLRYLAAFRPFTSLTYYPRNAVLLTADGELCAFLEAGDLAFARARMPWLSDVRTWSYNTDENVSALTRALGERGVATITLGIDDLVSYHLVAALLERMPGVNPVQAHDVLAAAKALKHAEELKVIAHAAEIAEIGMGAAVDAIRAGVRESDVAAEAAGAMIAAGSDALVAHPQVSADPLRRMAADRRIRHGDVVLVDLNVGSNGYIADFARTVAVGVATDEQRAAYRGQLACLRRGIELVRDGVTVDDIRGAMVEEIHSHGLEAYFHDYIIGHGIGTSDIPQEEPIIGAYRGSVRTLRPSMVLALEPGLFAPGIGPIRVEEMLLVTDGPAELLTRFPYDEVLLG